MIDRLAAFRYPYFRLFWTGQLIQNVGSWMQIVATGWLVLELTNSPAFLGFNAAFQAAPILLFSLVGGVIADRVDRYRLMVSTQAAQLIPDLALAVLVATRTVQVEHVFLYSFVSATISGLSTPARQAFVPRLVGSEALLSAIALNSVVWQGSAVFGPALAGWITANWDIAANFYICVVGGLVSLASLLLIRISVPPPVPATTQASPWQGLLEGARYAWRQTNVRTLLFGVAAVFFLGRTYSLFLPVFARDVYGVGPQGLGLMATMPAVGTILAAVVLAMIGKTAQARWFVVTGIAAGLGLLLFGASPFYSASLVLLMVIGAGVSSSSSLANSLLQQEIDDRLRGRVMSFFMAATWGAWRVGAVPIGLLAAATSAPFAIGLSGALLVAVLVPLAWSRGLGRKAAPTVAGLPAAQRT